MCKYGSKRDRGDKERYRRDKDAIGIFNIALRRGVGNKQ